MAKTEVRRIDIKVTTNGDANLKKIASGFSKVNQSINKTTSAITKFQNVFLAIQGAQLFGFSLGNLVQAIDSVQKFQTRLEAVEGSAAAAQKSFEGVIEVANRNFTSIEDLGVVYNRLRAALKDTGISAAGTLDITDKLIKSFRISGATAAETTGAVIQLSQGLASGQLRGQELRSVLESNVEIGGILAKSLGVTRGELLRFSEKRGGISAVEFLKALSDGAGSLDEAANKLRPTISEGLTKNFNLLQERLGRLNNTFDITGKAIKVIDAAFANLEIVLVAVGAALAYAAIPKAMTAIATSIGLVTTAITALVASPILGFLSKFAITVGVGIGSLAGWPAVLIAAGVALSGWILTTKTGIETIQGFVDTLDRLVFGTTKAERALARGSQVTKEATKPIQGLGKAFNELDLIIQDTFESYTKGIKSVSGERFPMLSEADAAANVAAYRNGGKVIFDFRVELAKLNEEYANTKNMKKYSEDLKKIQIEKLNKDLKEGLIDQINYDKQLRDIQLGKFVNNTREAFYEIRKLNAEFAKNGDLIAFSTGLRQINAARIEADTRQGRTDALTADLEKNKIAIELLNSAYANGATTLEVYNETVNGIKIKETNDLFKAGKLTIDQYYSSLVKLEGVGLAQSFNAGLSQYLSSAGTLASNFANVVDSTFQRLETSIFEFVKTGKFNFNQFTQAVLDDLLKIIIRAQIITPLAKGLLGDPTATTGGNTAVPAKAMGAAYDAAPKYYANGGIVTGRSSFLYGSGMRGVMGEAGPEAIIPLKRDSSGELGISGSGSNVTVNVINQANNTEVEQRERTDETGARVLDVLIVSKVKEGMSKGYFDKQFESQFGLRRRGV